ncbi:ester cyclase [Nonomuraea typhae]|uniref:Ester cyclase n=1 Tax=Nonomuraea typhae TaxID=2603600 RepID=A0ABW7Z1M2_9ACTN
MAQATEILLSALNASATGDAKAIRQYYAPDVVGWSAGEDIASVEDLLAEATSRSGALSEVRVEAAPVELPGGPVVAEWTMTARHTGPLKLDDGLAIAATGRRLELRGATFARLENGKVAGFRQYWDPADLLEQLGLMDEE